MSKMKQEEWVDIRQVKKYGWGGEGEERLWDELLRPEWDDCGQWRREWRYRQKVKVLVRRGVQLCCVRLEMPVGHPDGDEGHVVWKFTREAELKIQLWESSGSPWSHGQSGDHPGRAHREKNIERDQGHILSKGQKSKKSLGERLKEWLNRKKKELEEHETRRKTEQGASRRQKVTTSRTWLSSITVSIKDTHRIRECRSCPGLGRRSWWQHLVLGRNGEFWATVCQYLTVG